MGYKKHLRGLFLVGIYILGVLGIVASGGGGGGGGGGDDAPSTTASITVDPITADDIVDVLEAVGIINVTGSVGGAAGPGDIVNFAVNGNPYNDAVGVGSTFSIAVSGLDLATDTSFVAAVTGITTAGDPYTATTTSTHTVNLPTIATIIVDPITADDIVNAAESAGSINVTGSVGELAESGDSVDFTVNSTPYNGTVDVGNTFSIMVSGVALAADNSFDVTVSGTDIFGNPFSGTTTSTHTVDTVGSATITVDNITDDDVVNIAVESLGNINVTGSVGGEAAPGDMVSFTVNGADYSDTVAAGNTFSIPVAGSDLVNDTSFDVTVTGTDDVGNPISVAVTSTHTVVNSAPVTPATPLLGFDIKTFRFTWTDAPDATFYKLLENPDGVSGFSQVGIDVVQGTQTIDHIVPLYKRLNASYILQSCNNIGCTDSTSINISGTLVDAIGYFKGSNSVAQGRFGNSVDLSGDGSTLAVGAWGQEIKSGVVHIFTLSGNTWSQQAYVKASNADANDAFSRYRSVSLSDDGNTLAVGAYLEDSNATGIDGNQADNSVSGSGAVYVFTRSGAIWSQQAYVKASNADADDTFGHSVSLSDDGNTLAVGAEREDSNATGIDGNQADNSAGDAGAVYVFTRSGATWSQQAYVKASNTDAGDEFGWSVSLSSDGNTLAVGAEREASNATGINGNQSDNSEFFAGAVYVFTRSGAIWSQQAYVKASNTERRDEFGYSVSLSDNGNTLAVGAFLEYSNATGIDGNQADNSAHDAGAVYVFTRSGATWSQQAYVKASNTDANDLFGWSVSLSGDGNTLAVSAKQEASNVTGIDGNQADNSAWKAGVVYVFTRNGATWSQQAYVKASNTEGDDEFGDSVSLSGDGNTLAVGTGLEDSNADGIDGDQTDNTAFNAGAVYLY